MAEVEERKIINAEIYRDILKKTLENWRRMLWEVRYALPVSERVCGGLERSLRRIDLEIPWYGRVLRG